MSEDLHAVAADPSWNGEGPLLFYAVGADGLIVEVRDEIRTHRPVTVDLHGVTVSRNFVIAVGDAGTLVRAPLDGSEDWQVVDVGATEDLYAFIPSLGLVLGDGVLLVHDPLADTWTRAPAPAEAHHPRKPIAGRAAARGAHSATPRPRSPHQRPRE